MNKEELEQAFNETTDNAVNLLKENVELKKRIDRAIKMLNELASLYDDNYTVSDKAKDIIIILGGGNND